MRIGYSYWGFLGDHKLGADGKALSTPDGNAAYSWAIIHELLGRDYTVYAMQEDRDRPGFTRYGKELFASFSQEKRLVAYEGMEQTNGVDLPELDLLLVEWRFPIFGRNCHSWEGAPCFPSRWYKTGYDGKGSLEGEVLQPDLFRQYQLLKHYKERGTKIIFWDLDHKVLKHDEEYWKPDAVFETSKRPLHLHTKRTSVEFPIVVADLMQHPTLPGDPLRKLVYIGSRYERDDVITEWLKPISDAYPQQVEFWGNWTNSLDECKKLWPNVSFNGRITMSDFHRVYGTAIACPILAKKSYLETGFITPRPWEALMFGTIPVGLGSHLGVSDYVLPGFVAGDGRDMIEVVETLTGLSVENRDHLRRENVEWIEPMDVRYFVDKMEDVVDEVVDMGEDLRKKQGA